MMDPNGSPLAFDSHFLFDDESNRQRTVDSNLAVVPSHLSSGDNSVIINTSLDGDDDTTFEEYESKF